MPPTRATHTNRTANNSLIDAKGIVTRSKRTTENVIPAAKRRAVNTPSKDRAVKRAAFGDLTNAAGKSVIEAKKVFKPLLTTATSKSVLTTATSKSVLTTATSKSVSTTASSKSLLTTATSKSLLTTATSKSLLTTATAKSFLTTTTAKAVAKVTKDVKKVTMVQSAMPSRVVLKDQKNSTTEKSVTAVKPVAVAVKKIETIAAAPSRRSGRLARRSLVNSSDENSLYVSALDDSEDSLVTEEITKKVSETVINPVAKPARNCPVRPEIPSGVEDFDALHWDDPNQIGNYAYETFEYLKSREASFVIKDYMENQIHLNRWMRSSLVDWMVEVQETFELNHETLYLAVKLVDMYLSKVIVRKETLQLVGAASVFIASKFDERIPPLVEDLVYICDGAYTHNQLVRMEVSIIKAVNYDLGFPLSYMFQRRYARCAHVAMPQLTLARFILELSLMEYSFVTRSDSKLGAAALLLALRMQNISSWTPTLEFYSGYKLSDIKDLVIELNNMLHKPVRESLMTVRNKYAHKVFFEVASIPLLSNADLFN